MKQVDNYIGGNTLKPMYKGLGNHTKDHLLTTRRFKLEQTTIDDFTNNDRLGQTTTDVLTCNDKKEQTITDNIADNNEKQLTTTCVLTPQYPYDVIWYMNEVLKNVRGGEGNVNDKENNTYPALRAHLTPQAEDPSKARMTNYGIHTCYNTAARTKINDRANYNIHGNTHIGDSSLYARNDGQCNATYIGDGYASYATFGTSLAARNDEYRKDTTTLHYYINSYPSLRAQYAPTAVDPRCARMTKRNIPLCTKRQLE